MGGFIFGRTKFGLLQTRFPFHSHGKGGDGRHTKQLELA